LVEDDDFTISTKQPYTLFAGENMIYVDAGKRNKGNLRLSISEGTITPTDDEGYYIVRLKETGRVIIKIYNTKNNNEIGAASFEVKKKINVLVGVDTVKKYVRKNTVALIL